MTQSIVHNTKVENQDRDKIIEKFEIKCNALNYCLIYHANDPLKLSDKEMKEEERIHFIFMID